MICILDSIVVSMFCNFNVFRQLHTWWSVRLYNRSIALFWWAATVFDFHKTRTEGADMLTENTSHRNEHTERKRDQFFKRSVPLEINIFEWRKTSVIVFSSYSFLTWKHWRTQTEELAWIKKKNYYQIQMSFSYGRFDLFLQRSVLPKSIFWAETKMEHSYQVAFCFSLLTLIESLNLIYMSSNDRMNEWELLTRDDTFSVFVSDGIKS